jgi:uncharacterized protein YlaI
LGVARGIGYLAVPDDVFGTGVVTMHAVATPKSQRACKGSHAGKRYGAIRIMRLLSPDLSLGGDATTYEVRWICCGRIVTMTHRLLNSYKAPKNRPAHCKACRSAKATTDAKAKESAQQGEDPRGIQVKGWGWVPFLMGPMGR